MKKILDNKYLPLVSRFILGIVFMYASIDKLHDPVPFAQSIGNYKIMSTDAALIVATLLPWLELLCGVCLLLGFFIKGSALTTSVLLIAFTIVVISALIRSLDISCGCFTQDPTAQSMGWEKVAENSGLLLLSLYLFLSTTQQFTLDKFRSKLNSSVTM